MIPCASPPEKNTIAENGEEGFIYALVDLLPVGKPTGGQNLRTPWAIRRDRAAVSPVIATILMVAITVVLAAVLYVMVSGLVSGPGSTPQAIGVTVKKTPDGTNWELTLTDVPAGMAPSSVYLIVFKTDGTVNLTKTALSSLSVSSHGAQFVKIDTSATTIQPGDKILMKTSWYAAGTTFQLVDSDGVLAQGKLQ